ncbi:MAG: Rieske 2Fe-2S domain-containing protein [Methanomassiliicoccales archaeon]|nr:MAG: Rieske 2Fe-2S domain-containing protein [Methanomassiliicoccales archaeon]
MFVDVGSEDEIAEGGMVSFKVGGDDVVVARYAGKLYAFGRGCGHEGARLDRGTVNGRIVTCPLHFAQFDIVTGEALLGPADRNYGRGPPDRGRSLETHDIPTFKVKVENGRVMVDIEKGLGSQENVR